MGQHDFTGITLLRRANNENAWEACHAGCSHVGPPKKIYGFV